MPTKITNAEGQEVEMFSVQELEEMKKGLSESQKAELTKLQEEKQKTEEELTKYRDKDQNFQALRVAKEKSDLEASTYKKLHEEAINSVKSEVLSGMLADEYNQLLKSSIGDDAELKTKFEIEYNRLSDKPTTKDQLQKKFNDALALTTKFTMPTMHAGVISAANSGMVRKSGGPVSKEDAEMIKTIAGRGGLKISDDDITKYAK